MRRPPLVVAAPFVMASALAPSASATPPEARTVTLALFPENAAVAVDGHPRQHRNGVLELKGPLGAVFTVEAVANGGTVVQRVAVTDIGAFPARLVVPPPSAAPATWPAPAAPMVAPTDDCSQRTWRDDEGVKHYKPHCLFDDDAPEAAPAPAAARPVGTGSLTVVCLPKCDHVYDNGVDLGPGNVFNRPATPGAHALSLSAPNGVKKTIVVQVLADQTREVRITMDSSKTTIAAIDPTPAPVAAAPAPVDGTTDGFLTVASYPWTRVSENGKALCLTPCIKVPLAPGPHTLLLENDGESVKQTVSVTIRPGELTVKRYGFK